MNLNDFFIANQPKSTYKSVFRLDSGVYGVFEPKDFCGVGVEINPNDYKDFCKKFNKGMVELTRKDLKCTDVQNDDREISLLCFITHNLDERGAFLHNAEYFSKHADSLTRFETKKDNGAMDFYLEFVKNFGNGELKEQDTHDILGELLSILWLHNNGKKNADFSRKDGRATLDICDNDNSNPISYEVKSTISKDSSTHHINTNPNQAQALIDSKDSKIIFCRFDESNSSDAISINNIAKLLKQDISERTRGGDDNKTYALKEMIVYNSASVKGIKAAAGINLLELKSDGLISVSVSCVVNLDDIESGEIKNITEEVKTLLKKLDSSN